MRTLSVDFDGTLHLYTSGWGGPTHIPDEPVSGALDFLTQAVERFEVCIFSSRSSQPGGINAMRQWLRKHGLAEEVIALLKFPTDKPPAHVTIDDRALTFTGQWPTMDELHAFVPWNRTP